MTFLNYENGQNNEGRVITTILNYKLRIAKKRKPHISLSTRKRCTSLSQERDNSRVPQSPSNSTVRKSIFIKNPT